MDKEFLNRLDAWHKEDKHREIVKAIVSLSEEAWDFAVNGRLARALNNLGEYEYGLRVLESAADEGADDPLWHFRRGYSLYGLEWYAEAVEAFSTTLALDPNDEDAQDMLNACREALDTPADEAASPVLYEEEELDALEAHITRHFGPYDNVFHELYSPDIHVDIAIINPTPARPFYTLVTMGMGARRMAVPDELSGEGLDRAELLVCLPPNWDLQDAAEESYWPIRWLKILARLPGEEGSWLGWGHTVGSQGPLADNTALAGLMLISPCLEEDTPGLLPLPGSEEAAFCPLPGGERVCFYQMLPLYTEEMELKLAQDADGLLERMKGRVSALVDISRENVCAPRPLEAEDFHESEYGFCETEATLWGNPGVSVTVDFPGGQDWEEGLEEYLPALRERLRWLEENRSALEDCLLEDGMLELAEDWASGAEEAEDEEDECYVMEDGQKVFLPVREEDFRASLYMESVGIDLSSGEPALHLCLCCSPDYFAGHCLCVSVDTEGNIESGGLAG